jgi:hypothetical protein
MRWAGHGDQVSAIKTRTEFWREKLSKSEYFEDRNGDEWMIL